MLNRCEFIGNLGRDPEVRTMQSGEKVCNLSLGVTKKWKNQAGERQEKTEWVRVVVFNKGLIPVLESYTRKGSKIYIAGEMQTRKWTDQSGQEKYSTEIVLNNFNGELALLDSKGDKQPVNKPEYPADVDGVNDIDDSIPF